MIFYFSAFQPVFEKTYATKQKKRKKSRFWILKKRIKTFKNIKVIKVTTQSVFVL